MRVKLRAFPISFFTVRCVKHECWVSVNVKESKDRSDKHTVGASMTAARCEKGGEPRESNCTHTWEITFSGPGDITITD